MRRTADSVTDRYKTQKISDKAVSNDPFMLKYFLDWYNTQQMCDKTVDDFVAASVFFLVCLLQVTWLKNIMKIYLLISI